MKKFNLFKEIIIVEKIKLLTAINSAKVFGITISGEIVYEPYGDQEILIYSGKHTAPQINALMPKKSPSLADIFGKNYQVIEDDERVLIKAFSNWQELIGINTPRASYDDTTGDGVAEFSDKELEEIGWHGAEFDINYRTLVELLEESCEGVLLCIEQEEPYQFSGLGFLSDNKHAKEILFMHSQKEVKKAMQEDTSLTPESLNDDERDAAQFFNAL